MFARIVGQAQSVREPLSSSSFSFCSDNMSSDQQVAEAIAAWHDYGDAIDAACRFPAGSRIDYAALTRVIKRGDDASLKAFVAYARKQAAELRTMTFLVEE